jgi:hypothetical protein
MQPKNDEDYDKNRATSDGMDDEHLSDGNTLKTLFKVSFKSLVIPQYIAAKHEESVIFSNKKNFLVLFSTLQVILDAQAVLLIM